MFKKIGAATIATLMLTTMLAGCEVNTKSGAPESDKLFERATEVKDSDNGYLDFVFNLSHECAEDDEENIVISPTSLLFMMEMLGAGAKGNTLDEISSVMVPGVSNEEALGFVTEYYKDLDGDSVKAGNICYINSDFDGALYKDYMTYIYENFDAELNVAKFNDKTVKEINSKVDDMTDGMIPSAISDLNPSDNMVIINAICFDERWKEEYKPGQIQDMIFNDLDGTKEPVAFMISSEDYYFETDKATGIRKYYKGGDYAFIAILPKDESISANEFLRDFTAEDYKEFLNSETKTDTQTYIPEFSCDFDCDLKSILKKMGINDAFSEEDADFSNISDKPLFISDVEQKAYIEVNRNGTRAAAVTRVGATSSGAIRNCVSLNRPFVYMIVDTETDTPLFIGSVNSING